MDVWSQKYANVCDAFFAREFARRTYVYQCTENQSLTEKIYHLWTCRLQILLLMIYCSAGLLSPNCQNQQSREYVKNPSISHQRRDTPGRLNTGAILSVQTHRFPQVVYNDNFFFWDNNTPSCTDCHCSRSLPVWISWHGSRAPWSYLILMMLRKMVRFYQNAIFCCKKQRY